MVAKHSFRRILLVIFGEMMDTIKNFSRDWGLFF